MAAVKTCSVSFAITVLFASCNLFQKKVEHAGAVAKVYDTYLYASDLKGLIPKGTSLSDSNSIVKKYVQHWVEQQVLLHQAENNLDKQQPDLNRQIEDYRSSLIIYAYEKELVRQKLDTNVTDNDIEKYYDDNKKDFQLKNDIVKIVYVKAGKKSPNIDKVKGWILSADPKDREQLSKFCAQYAENFFLNDEAWLMFDDVLKEVPIQTANEDLFLQNNRFVQIDDSTNTYFLGIRGFMIKNSTSPLSFEKEDIKKILLNKRKIDLIDQMKNTLFQQAELKSHITYY